MMSTPQACAASSSEPLLFENVGEVVTGLSYVHSVIPVDIAGFEKHLVDYQATLEREFDNATLERTHRDFMQTVQAQSKVTKTTSSLNFDRSMIAKWREIGETHVGQVKELRKKVMALYEAVPPVHLDDKPNEQFAVPTDAVVSSNPTFASRGDLPAAEVVSTRRPVRIPRFISAITGAVGLGIGGTAFGIYNTAAIESIKASISKIEGQLSAFKTAFTEFSKDIVEMQDEIHGILLDSAFDTGLLVTKLQSQYATLLDRYERLLAVMQQAHHHRLALGYLDSATLKKIFNQAKFRAKQVNCVLLIRQPSELFQLELSYTYDGRQLLLMLHIPISPAESTMRLYRLHRFPLPLSNDTFLIPSVEEHLLGISNANHRFAIQYALSDLAGCHQMGRTYLCNRNGMLFKFPEDTCLGSLYQQKYELAMELCTFNLEKAREFVRQLKDNWYLVFTDAPLTIPMVCANNSYGELHVKSGASKFHLSAGCTADLPRHRLISDLSVLIPQDYIQFDMEWDPQTFLPELRDYVVPEFHRLQRYGASKVTLAQLQSNIAHSQDTPAWYHSVHFSANTIAIATAIIGCCATLFMCIQSQRRRARERRGQKIEEAVRVALNAGTPHPHYNYPAPLALPMPIVSHPPSTVYVQPPVNPHVFDARQPMSRPHSFTNLTSVSEAAARRYEDQTIPLAPSCPKLSDMKQDNLPGYTLGYQTT